MCGDQCTEGGARRSAGGTGRLEGVHALPSRLERLQGQVAPSRSLSRPPSPLRVHVHVKMRPPPSRSARIFKKGQPEHSSQCIASQANPSCSPLGGCWRKGSSRARKQASPPSPHALASLASCTPSLGRSHTPAVELPTPPREQGPPPHVNSPTPSPPFARPPSKGWPPRPTSFTRL